MSKKHPKVSYRPNAIIEKTDIEDRQTNLVISYKYLITSNKYSLDSIKDTKIKLQFYNDLITKLNEYCSFENFEEHISSNRRYAKNNHIHPIDWNDNRIRERNFTSLDGKLMEQIKDDCWQLGINNTTFRIHGFFIENVFYVVWLDPLHMLYAS